MRPYTIVKALTLFFGTVSVVARSLPGRRSEISANAARGHGSGNHLVDSGDAGPEVDLSTVTTGVDDLKQHLQSFVKISEAVLNGMVFSSTYSIPANPAFPKRDTTFPKRDDTLGGARCYTACANPAGSTKPDPDDCTELWNTIQSMDGQFSVDPQQAVHYQHGTCASFLINNSADTVTYDYWNLAGATHYLTGFCVMKNQASYGSCKFGDIKTDINNAAYVVVLHSSDIDE